VRFIPGVNPHFTGAGGGSFEVHCMSTQRGPGAQTQDVGKALGGTTQNLGIKPSEVDSERLVSLLSEQLERGALPEAREITALLLRINPKDQDARDIQEYLDEQLASITAGQVGLVHRLRGQRTWVNGAAFSPDGRRVLSASGGALDQGRFQDGTDHCLSLWDVATGQRLCRLRGHKTAVNCVAFAPDGRRFLSGSRGGSITVWDAAFLTVIRQFQRRGRPVWGLAFSPDGRRALSATAEKTISLWDVRDGRLLQTLEGHTSGVNAVAFAADGRRALSAGYDRTARLWDLENGRQLARLEGHAQAVTAVAFTDNRHALSASLDKVICLWDLGSGRLERRFTGHAAGISTLAFSPEGRFVLSGGADNVVRLWDVTSGQELRRFLGHTAAITQVAFSPDGRLALSASRDRTVRLWQLPSPLDAIETPTSIFSLVKELSTSGILTAAQVTELTEQLQSHFTEPRALAWHLIERGWVTPYQINQLILGRGSELCFDGYVVLDRLGEGGMGKVLKARNPADGQPVALKVALPQMLGNAEEIEQFWWESQALGRLSHPNVVRGFDAHRDRQPPFFIMEYLEGTDLENLVRRNGPLAAALACEYIRQAALGLQHAHEQHFIHRDIKPANLLRTTAPASPEQKTSEPLPLIKVIDWGIADTRLPAGQTAPRSPMPKDQVLGTPDYMPPEQATAPDTADIRSDIYSLGCALYQLLTGKPPFAGSSYAQKLLKHQQVPPPPVQELRPDLPDGLADVVHKMLAKNQDERYQTPAAVAEALAPFSTSQGARAAGVEKRSHVRYPCKIKASCRLLTSSAEGHWDAEVRNISRGGVLLLAAHELKPGSVLAIELEATPSCSRFVRVIHVQPATGASQWLVGCAAAREFTEVELGALLKGVLEGSATGARPSVRHSRSGGTPSSTKEPRTSGHTK
jgi:WD40 repeat protein/serine/threonine protein kinase